MRSSSGAAQIDTRRLPCALAKSVTPMTALAEDDPELVLLMLMGEARC
jgi:hypothetical protein